jgi:hypothetical protein
MTEAASYDTDFHAWALRNAERLRDGRLDELDVEHSAEELESMVASERRELLNRLEVLLLHLLKHQYRPERRGKRWQLTINHPAYRHRTLVGAVAESRADTGRPEPGKGLPNGGSRRCHRDRSRWSSFSGRLPL